MNAPFDYAAVERAAAGGALALPRTPHRGKVGEVRSSSVGSSLELHDFRHYHPGDDVRQVDWNAVARTGELVLRVRQDEVSPRVEIIVDASKSMAVTEAKAARLREVTAWLCLLAQRTGLAPTLLWVGARCERISPYEAKGVLGRLTPDAADGFDAALRRAPPLRPCGLRVVVSDLLFEASAAKLAEHWARGASGLHVVQLLDAEDVAPLGGEGAQLTDSETGETLERMLTGGVLADYQRRLEAHLQLWSEALTRVRAGLHVVSSEHAIDVLARRELFALMEAA